MTQKRILLLLSLFIFFLLLFFILISMPYVPLSKWLTAQVVQMSLTIQPAPTLTIGGNVLTPTQSESQQFEASTGGTFPFTNPDGSSVTITFFIGTTQVTLDFFIDTYEKSAIIAQRPLPTGLDVVGSLIYDMRTFIGSTGTATFDNPFAMTVGYTDALLGNLDEETLNVYFFDEAQNQWVAFATTTRDTVNNTITILTDHLTLFATLGEQGATAPAAAAQKRGGGGPIQGISRVGTLVTPAALLPIESGGKELQAEETKRAALEATAPPLRQEEITTEKPEAKVETADEGIAPPDIEREKVPTLFDIGITPSAGEPEKRGKAALLLVITGVLVLIAVLGMGIFFIRKKWQ